MSWLITHQLSFMLFMSGVCAILSLSTLFIKSLTPQKKRILALMELAAMFLFIFDRYSYLYRGDPSEMGFVMVRFSNGLVYFLQIFIPFLVTGYLKELLHQEESDGEIGRWLHFCDLLFAVGSLLIVISQFNGLYYTFDDQNIYQRSPMHFLCYIFPLLMVIIQGAMLIWCRAKLNKKYVISLLVSITLPSVASIVQFFHYGLSLTNITTGLVVIGYYIYMLIDLNRSVEMAREREIELLREGQKKETAIFLQTIEALAFAIDAKDRYTHGHSTRVALYSRLIAKEAGYSDEECQQIYFAALLHDIGKIGVPDGILNKTTRLTDNEFELIKSHTLLGYQILSNILLAPELSIGAHYHHERYDGKGYPDHLAGEDIPVIARIIAVADAYDAMTSTRSYRNPLPPQKVKQELIEGIGTQFDPAFARILIRLVYAEEVGEDRAR